jgi:endonuclease/exonuclease/phosphatase family metal-dependent hydrolase
VEEPPVIKTLPAQDVRIISVNLWNNETIAERSARMSALLNDYHADSFGVQECGQEWAEILEASMGARYGRVGLDTEGAEMGANANYVYYLKEKYQPIASGTFWLSPTPNEPSMYGGTVSSKRNCSWVVLENIETGFRYVHMNAHLDYADTNVTVVQVQMLRNQMLRFEAMGYPVFVTGDFNTEQGSVAYQRMVASESIADAKKVAKSTMDTPTHGNGTVIDYCFVTGKRMDVSEYKVLSEETVSDHKMLVVTATVHALSEQKAVDHTPSFAEDTEIEIERNSSESYNVKIRFSQAKSEMGMLAVSYRIRLLDAAGETVTESTVGARSFAELPPEGLFAYLVGGEPNRSYVIEITPISILGEEGMPLQKTIVWNGAAFDPNHAPDPDLLNLIVRGDSVADLSDNDYTIAKTGDVVIANDRISFDRNGVVKVVGIKDHFEQMSKGFTLEFLFTTGDDIKSFQGVVSCKHSGGFGVFLSNGTLSFDVHNEDGYINAPVSGIKANTTYHLTCVFDGECLRFYLNGVLMTTVAFPGNMKYPTNDAAAYLAIGGDSNSAGTGEHYGNGSISYVCIYSSALQTAQIEGLVRDKMGE